MKYQTQSGQTLETLNNIFVIKWPSTILIFLTLKFVSNISTLVTKQPSCFYKKIRNKFELFWSYGSKVALKNLEKEKREKKKKDRPTELGQRAPRQPNPAKGGPTPRAPSPLSPSAR
jgi:hypothetical protein